MKIGDSVKNIKEFNLLLGIIFLIATIAIFTFVGYERLNSVDQLAAFGFSFLGLTTYAIGIQLTI